MVVLQEKLADPAFSLNNIEPNSICYPGTHDTDTCRGWFDGGSVGEIRTLAQIEQSRQTLLRLTGGDAHSVADDMITLAFSSAANLAIVLMQDFIGLDNSARFNLPGTSTNNWRWRRSRTSRRCRDDSPAATARGGTNKAPPTSRSGSNRSSPKQATALK